jgi:hypothetical protein
MIAMLYDEAGAIRQTVVGQQDLIEATASVMGLKWLAYDGPYDPGAIDAFDASHRVVNGQFAAIG